MESCKKMNSSINPLVDFSIKIVSSKKDSVAVLKSQKSMKMFTNTHNLPSNESSNMLQVNYSVEWNNITFSIPSKSKARRVILKSLSGSANSGEMTAIMGPSGAGKTSLMNILAGFRGHGSTGEVKINNIKRNAKHKRLSCYIMQEDHLVPTLNVLETMMVAANLKLSKHLNASQKLSNVNDILEKLGLTECKYTRVTKISGGQRKRLCIAQELVNNPPILYLDEPTSGLDSSSSYQCLLLLKQLSLEGKTIICTIHQPSARLFELFDKLYMLADGCCLYDGKVNDLLPYLNSHGFSCPSFHNPADFMTEIASGEHEISYMRLISSKQNGESVAKYCMEEENGEIWKPINRIQGPEKKKVDNILPESLKLEYLCNDIGLWTQFYVLFVRALKATLRDGILMKLRLSAHIVVGVLIGIIYKDIGNDAVKVLSNAGFIFFSMLFLLFASMMPTVLTFPLEMKVFHREHLNHWYSIKAYYLAKTMADIPFQLIFPSIYTSIVYWMTGQPNDISRFFIFLSISVLVSLVSQSLGLIIGAATSIQNAVFLGPITAVPMLLFSGFFVHLDTIPHYLHWLSYLSYIRYAFEGSLICIYGMSREDLDCNVTFCLYKEPSKYLEDMDIDTTQMTWYYDVLGLIIFFLIIRFVGYLILKIKSLHKRNLLCSRCF